MSSEGLTRSDQALIEATFKETSPEPIHTRAKLDEPEPRPAVEKIAEDLARMETQAKESRGGSPPVDPEIAALAKKSKFK